MNKRYLTKSRFVSAMKCPTKLYYMDKEEYANQQIKDPFLQALAEGGFQVGALARCYFPKGVFIDAPSNLKTVVKTNSLLNQENIILFEGALQYKNLLAKCDILIKDSSKIQIIEVKSKSFNPDKDTICTKKGKIRSEWKDYILDIAFQRYVAEKIFKGYEIEGYLMLVNKQALCPTDGLNQKFKIIKDTNNRKKVEISSDLCEEDLKNDLLLKINVDKYCDIIYRDKYINSYSFDELIDYFSKCYEENIKIPPVITSGCSSCEFMSDRETVNLKDGYKECWKEAFGWEDKDFKAQTVLELWNSRRKDRFLKENKIKLSDLSLEDVNPEADGKPGLSSSQRQWIQIQKNKENDNSYWIDKENLKREMDKFIYPLHFIDFETSMVAIPFNKNRHPYEGIAFQFSHHIVREDGSVEHKGEYLNTEQGKFPNFEFIRRLKKELSEDNGSIFRYATHENTFLNIIYEQISSNANVSDKDELINFIQSISKSKSSSKEKWLGGRNMIDMLELVKRYYYDPATKGSNSIKHVLPAIINSSDFLKDRYSKPIYGSPNGIKSNNFKDWVWINFTGDVAMDPYKLLPRMFNDVSEEDVKLLSNTDAISDGGAALTAYAKMQFEEISDYEREEIKKALLKYCELDTLAMVMVYEAWREMIK